MLGTVALMNHTMHFRPAILIHEAKNTAIKQVTIHSQPGMGIVGHRSHNVLMEGLRIIPTPGKYQSTNTDATHFTSCTGTIRFNGCMFEGQGDDATNVHAYYHKFTKEIGDDTYEIKLEDRWCTHACVLDFPDVGNTIEIVKKSTLEVVDSLTVLKVDTFPKEWRSVIKLSGVLPGSYNDFYFIDVTRLPALEFVNSYVGSHLARAVLVKTRNVLIENCTFREGTGTAIHIGAEGDWREGAGSANVTIRNNRILRCGRGDGTNDGACGIAINVKAPDNTVPGIHKNIVIEQNIIEGENAFTGISIQGAENVKLLNNRVTGCSKAVDVKFSTNVDRK
jgi:polygalacturonase